MVRKREEARPAGCPDWMVTYGDMTGLLLCFFVMLMSMSELKKNEQFRQVAKSVREAFGYDAAAGMAAGEVDPIDAIIRDLQAIVAPAQQGKEGDALEEGIEGRVRRVTSVRDGIEIVIGGRIIFDRFSAVLKPIAEERVAGLAELIRGKNTKVIVRGHATSEPLPADSVYSNPMDLSFMRAKAVAEVLERNGVQPVRIRLEASGDREPINRQAYTEERRAVNRRVEIIVTESLVEDYAGRPITDEQEMFDDAQ